MEESSLLRQELSEFRGWYSTLPDDPLDYIDSIAGIADAAVASGRQALKTKDSPEYLEVHGGSVYVEGLIRSSVKAVGAFGSPNPSTAVIAANTVYGLGEAPVLQPLSARRQALTLFALSRAITSNDWPRLYDTMSLASAVLHKHGCQLDMTPLRREDED